MTVIRKTPTIQDVARHANVSTATVSRALSAPSRVSEATRERVEDAVRITGYTINQAARSLRMREARTILIALPNIGNPFYSTILDAVVEDAATRGYGVLVAKRLGSDPTQWLSDYFLSNRADGLLLFDASLDIQSLHKLPLYHGRLPLVAITDEVMDESLDVVTTDNEDAGRRATEHLIALGHTQIGHLGGQAHAHMPNARGLGFRAAMRDAGLPVREDWVFPGDYSVRTAMTAAHAFLGMKDRPTAIFSSNDEMAVGFLSTVRQEGIECPRDISIVGYDDIDMVAHYNPPLTTMRMPRREMARVATQKLLDILEDRSQPREASRTILVSELMLRSSTKRLDGRG